MPEVLCLPELVFRSLKNGYQIVQFSPGQAYLLFQRLPDMLVELLL
jgi:hypothetical protein